MKKQDKEAEVKKPRYYVVACAWGEYRVSEGQDEDGDEIEYCSCNGKDAKVKAERIASLLNEEEKELCS